MIVTDENCIIIGLPPSDSYIPGTGPEFYRHSNSECSGSPLQTWRSYALGIEMNVPIGATYLELAVRVYGQIISGGGSNEERVMFLGRRPCTTNGAFPLVFDQVSPIPCFFPNGIPSGVHGFGGQAIVEAA